MSVLIVNSMSCDMLWQFDAVFFFFFFFSPSGKAESRTPNSQHYIFTRRCTKLCFRLKFF